METSSTLERNRKNLYALAKDFSSLGDELGESPLQFDVEAVLKKRKRESTPQEGNDQSSTSQIKKMGDDSVKEPKKKKKKGENVIQGNEQDKMEAVEDKAMFGESENSPQWKKPKKKKKKHQLQKAISIEPQQQKNSNPIDKLEEKKSPKRGFVESEVSPSTKVRFSPQPGKNNTPFFILHIK